MAIPDFQTLMLPVLRLSVQETRVRDAVVRLAEAFDVSEDEQAEMLPSGGNRTIVNRMHWAVTHLCKAELIERPRRGYFVITDKGRKVLADEPDRIDLKFLAQFEKFVEFRNRTGDQLKPMEPIAPTLGTPEERMDAALGELNEALLAELLERVLSITPLQFENLVIDLMLGMGYGGGGSGERLSRAADGGVDGVINEDILGLDIIYLQAKRYAPDNAIGVEKIREFAGVLDEKGSTKGVFVTTSYFSAPAIAYARQNSSKRLILIDGGELTRLLVKHGVAVRVYRTVELKRIDTDYFDDFDS